MTEFLATYSPLLAWITIAVFAGIVEGMTAAVVSIWFVVGAVIGAIAFALGAPIWLQVTLALVSCGACLGLVRKLCLGNEKSQQKALEIDSFASSIESKRGTVSISIKPGETGQVKIDGDYWQARSFDDNANIDEGTRIVVYKVDGTTCIVAPVED